jgi:hypothetical protein
MHANGSHNACSRLSTGFRCHPPIAVHSPFCFNNLHFCEKVLYRLSWGATIFDLSAPTPVREESLDGSAFPPPTRSATVRVSSSRTIRLRHRIPALLGQDSPLRQSPGTSIRSIVFETILSQSLLLYGMIAAAPSIASAFSAANASFARSNGNTVTLGRRLMSLATFRKSRASARVILATLRS